MSVSKKDVRSAFSKAGLSEMNKDMLSKCVALASSLHVTPEQMAECWEAFSLNKQVTVLDDHTFSSYRTQLVKDSESTPGGVSKNGAVQTRPTKREATDQSHLVTPPVKQLKRGAADNQTSVDQLLVQQKGVASPSRTPMSLPKYDEREKAGELVMSYNPKSLPSISSNSPKAGRCLVDTSTFDDSNVTKPYRHMFTTMEDRAKALQEHLQKRSEEISTRFGITSEAAGGNEGGIAPLAPVNVPNSEMVTCLGRICNEAHSGKLNATSVVLEGSSVQSGGARVQVDMSHLKETTKTAFSLFPGQIVAVEGMNATGRNMVARRICEGAAHDANTSSVGEMRRFHHDQQDSKPLQVFSACGPFTTSDRMDYAPFVDLINVVMENSPDVVILSGPFVDLRQSQVREGKPMIENEDGISDVVTSYEGVFASQISGLLEEFYAEDNHTQFILVPSLDDATARWVYPQPPLQDRLEKPFNLSGSSETYGVLGLDSLVQRKKVHCLSNPCTFKLNEVVFGVTSTDVLFQMSTEVTNAHLPPGSRLHRVSQHLLQQRSFYPLFPPPANAHTNLDLNKMEQFQLPCQPDVMIVPSKLSCFASPVLESTMVINPGHLVRGTTGGTYAVMHIHPIARDAMDELGGDDVVLKHGIENRIHVEIKRV